MSTQIKITACDNEFILKAYQTSSSYEIATIKSGNSNPVDVTITLQAGSYGGGVEANGVDAPLSESTTVELPAGTYYLVAVGINWGGPTNFKYSISGISLGTEQDSTATGIVYTQPPFKVTV